MYEELWIRTEYDERDLMHVMEIFFYDEEGDEVICDDATLACDGIATCADQGTDLWPWLRNQVELHLRDAGIEYKALHFEDVRGD